MYKNIEEELIDMARNPSLLTKDMDNVGQIVNSVEAILSVIDTTLMATHTLTPFTEFVCLLKQSEELLKHLASTGNATIQSLHDCRKRIEKAYEDGSIFNHGVVFGAFSTEDIVERPQESERLQEARKICDDLDSGLFPPAKEAPVVKDSFVAFKTEEDYQKTKEIVERAKEKVEGAAVKKEDLEKCDQKIQDIMTSVNQEHEED